MKSAALSRNRLAESGTTSLATAIDWNSVADALDAHGCAVVGPLLSSQECAALAALYSANNDVFRSTVVMARHGFGRGEYKYFAYPLPQRIACLRATLYPHLALIANDWNAKLGTDVKYPESHEEYLRRCHRAGQSKPTPLLLQYGPGD